MLQLTGRGSSKNCNGVNRRDFMQIGTLGAMGITLPGYLAAKEKGLIDKRNEDRACIMIFNLGAPSHVEQSPLQLGRRRNAALIAFLIPLESG